MRIKAKRLLVIGQDGWTAQHYAALQGHQEFEQLLRIHNHQNRRSGGNHEDEMQRQLLDSFRESTTWLKVCWGSSRCTWFWKFSPMAVGRAVSRQRNNCGDEGVNWRPRKIKATFSEESSRKRSGEWQRGTRSEAHNTDSSCLSQRTCEPRS
jgi:hypothetical protein